MARDYQVALLWVGEPNEKGVPQDSYELLWEDKSGIYREGLAPDGKPAGYRRAQCFRGCVRSKLKALIDAGNRVQVVDADPSISRRNFGAKYARYRATKDFSEKLKEEFNHG